MHYCFFPLAASFACCLVPAAVAHRPGEDWQPVQVATAGRTLGAFEVLQPGSVLESGVADASFPFAELADYSWTAKGANWAARFFQDKWAALKPRSQERVRPEQLKAFVRKSGGVISSTDLQKGLQLGFIVNHARDHRSFAAKKKMAVVLPAVRGRRPRASAMLSLQTDSPETGKLTESEFQAGEIGKNELPADDAVVTKAENKHVEQEPAAGGDDVRSGPSPAPSPEDSVVQTQTLHGQTSHQESSNEHSPHEKETPTLAQSSEPAPAPSSPESEEGSAHESSGSSKAVPASSSTSSAEPSPAPSLETAGHVSPQETPSEKQHTPHWGGSGTGVSAYRRHKKSPQTHQMVSGFDLLSGKIGVAEADKQLEYMEGHETHGEMRHDEKLVGLVVAMLLLGFVTFDLCILYMVNYPDAQVRSYSYKMVSQCLSILCAVLLQSIQMGFFKEFLLLQWIMGIKPEGHELEDELLNQEHAEELAHGHIPFGQEAAMFVVSFLLFICWFVLITYLSRKHRGNHDSLFAVNALVSHAAAFVFIHAFSNLQENLAIGDGKHWRKSNYLLAPLFCMGLLRLLTAFSGYVREYYLAPEASEKHEPAPAASKSPPALPTIAEADAAKEEDLQQSEAEASNVEANADEAQAASSTGAGSEETKLDSNPEAVTEPSDAVAARPSLTDMSHGHDAEDWREHVAEAEDEMCAIAIAYFIRQASLMFICGRVPFEDGDFEEHTDEMFHYFILTIFVWVVFLIGVTYYIRHSDIDQHENFTLTSTWRFIKFLQILFAMTIAWHCQSLGRWCIQPWVHHTALQFVVSAFALSPVCVVTVVLIDKMADHRLMYEATAEILILGAGLLIGFAWEKAFHMAIHTVIHFSSNLQVAPEAFEICLCLTLVLILLPAWRYFIMPYAAMPVPEREWFQEAKQRLSLPMSITAMDKVRRLSLADRKSVV